jgi:hypothetical protein
MEKAMISIGKQRVIRQFIGQIFSPFFSPAIKNNPNYPILNGLQRICAEIGGQRVFNRFARRYPTNTVSRKLTIAKTRPNGIFRRFNRFPPQLRTAASGLKVGH